MLQLISQLQKLSTDGLSLHNLLWSSDQLQTDSRHLSGYFHFFNIIPQNCDTLEPQICNIFIFISKDQI